MNVERKVYTDEDMRAVVNEVDPKEAFILVLSLTQRLVVALEKIADKDEPTKALFDSLAANATV